MDLKIGSRYQTKTQAFVTDDVDVLIAGGGTAGVIAAIAAGRAGANVVLIEQRGSLGGMMTLGNAGLTKYIIHNNNQKQYREILSQLESDPASVQIIGGIPMEITNRLIENGAGLATKGKAGSYVFTSQEDFEFLLLSLAEEAGVKLLLYSQIVDVLMNEKTVRGIVVENKSGRQILLGKIVVDATGDGDVAAKAGAPFVVGIGPDDLCARDGTAVGKMDSMGVMFQMVNVNFESLLDYLEEHPNQFLVQPISLQSFSDVKASYAAGDMTTFRFVSCTGWGHQIYNHPMDGVATLCCPLYEGSGLDVKDLTQGQIHLAKDIHNSVKDLKENVPGFENAFLFHIPEIGIRETRHIHGDYVLNIEDIMTQRQFHDTIGRGSHPIDICQPVEEITDQHLEKWYFNIPYRCLVAKNVDNVLLAGRCISATHEAYGCTRPTVQCMVTGQAAGLAAAICAKQNVSIHSLDTDVLCKKLSDDGVIL